jgi:hypothetical protein
VNGKFLGPGSIVPDSQAGLSSLLEECFEISQEIKAQDESKHVASSLKPIHDRLSEIRADLENLVLTHRWSLRETDLWNYSLSLQEIDKMRIDGKFVDSEGVRPEGQYVSTRTSSDISRTFDMVLLSIMLGIVVPSEKMLRSHISVTFLKRACF